MWLLKGLLLVVSLNNVICQDYYKTRAGTQLEFKEIRQQLKADDPSGVNHKIKVVIDSHTGISNVNKWMFAMYKGGEEKAAQYYVDGDGSNPSTQTEFTFDGSLVQANSIFLAAFNSTTQMVAFAYAVAKLEDMKSSVAWVGGYDTGKSASLRVVPGSLLKEITVGSEVCDTTQSPCYYITPEIMRPIERCLDNFDSAPNLKHCDDKITNFKEAAEKPALFLARNDTLEVEFTFRKEKFSVEVVAYDPLDHTRIFTTERLFRCRFPIGKYWDEGEKMRCRQALKLPKDQSSMMVLVVKTKDNKVVESSLLKYGDAPLPPQDDKTGVIVGAVIGSLFGLAIIVLLVICFMKKKDKKSLKTERGGTAVYSTTTTTDPVEA